MIFLPREGPHFRKNILKHRKKALKVQICWLSRIFVAYYNRWHQSTNWSTIEILIKINLEKALNLNFFEKVFLLGVKKFNEIKFKKINLNKKKFNIKIIWKKPYSAKLKNINVVLKFVLKFHVCSSPGFFLCVFLSVNTPCNTFQ